MGKSRRPKGTHSSWEPKPALDPDVLRAVPLATDTAIPAVLVSQAAQTIAVPGRPKPKPESRSVSKSGSELRPEAAADAGEPVVPEVAAPPVLASPVLASPVAAPPVTASPAPPPVGEHPGPARQAAVAPDPFDIAGIGATIADYMRGEGEAAVAHLRALAEARSAVDLVNLQFGEVQRAADASLTCWGAVVRTASRGAAFR